MEFNAGLGGRYHATTLSASGSFQYHFDIGDIAGFKWFVGGGATVFHSFYNNSKYGSTTDYGGSGFGIFPTGGVDYKFANIPLNLSVDARPTIIVAGGSAYNSFNGSAGISARYTFK